MSEAIPHHDSPESVHYNVPDQRVKHRAASFGLTALCIILVTVGGGLAYKLKKQDAVVTDLQAQVTKANAEATGAKAQLADLTTKSADLQSQLDQAKRAGVDSQAQIKKGEETESALKAQLAKAQKDFQSQQDTTKTQMAELQSQLGQANTSSAGLRKELDAAKTQISDLNVQVVKAKETPAPQQAAVTAPARELPLTTETKNSFFGGTHTLRINNPGNDALNVNITVAGSTDSSPRSATIAPNGTFEVKNLATGAQVSIASEGYSPMSVTVK